MAFVVVGHRPSSALLHRQTGLGAVERLDLALLRLAFSLAFDPAFAVSDYFEEERIFCFNIIGL
jgi:hypothetical protein